MEFNIDVHTNLNGEITIEDYSKEYNQYFDEDLEVVTSYDSYKYSQSATINSVLKLSMDKAVLIDVLLNKHTEDLDSATFKIKEDGYYVVNHFVLPTKEWYENASDEYKEYYESIYFVDDEKIFKVVDGEIEEVSIKEVLERNIEGTTIKKCKVDVFYTGHLQQCYINYCKRLFDNLLNQCSSTKNSDDIFARDFIWMTLNVIDYLIGFK
jgi:hypothetical protein